MVTKSILSEGKLFNVGTKRETEIMEKNAAKKSITRLEMNNDKRNLKKEGNYI